MQQCLGIVGNEQFRALRFVTLGPFHCVYIHLCLSLCIFCVFFHTARRGGLDGIEAYSLVPIFLQCFDTVGWVI